MYNSPAPVSGVWLSLAPAGVGDSLGHQGCEFSLWNSVTVRGLTAAPGWTADGAETSQGARREEAARAEEGDAQGRDVTSQPTGRTGSCCVSIPLCPPGKGGTLGEAPQTGRVQLVAQWAQKCLFLPLLKRAALIEGEGCPSWCCLKGSLRC